MFLFRFLSDVMTVISVKCSRHKLLLCCTACATFLCLTLVSVVDRWKPQSIPQLAPMSVNDPPNLSSTQVSKATFVALSNFVFLCVIRWHQPVIVSLSFLLKLSYRLLLYAQKNILKFMLLVQICFLLKFFKTY